MQFLIRRISVLGILYVSNIHIFENHCFLSAHGGGVTIAPLFENCDFIAIKRNSFFDVLPTNIKN